MSTSARREDWRSDAMPRSCRDPSERRGLRWRIPQRKKPDRLGPVSSASSDKGRGHSSFSCFLDFSSNSVIAFPILQILIHSGLFPTNGLCRIEAPGLALRRRGIGVSGGVCGLGAALAGKSPGGQRGGHRAWRPSMPKDVIDGRWAVPRDFRVRPKLRTPGDVSPGAFPYP
jgi:hypothetical protein